VERAQLAVGAADDDHGGARGVDLLGEVAARFGGLLDASHVQPGPAEDRVAFDLVVRGRDRVVVRDGAGAELGVVLSPRPCRGLLEVGHQVSPRRLAACSMCFKSDSSVMAGSPTMIRVTPAASYSAISSPGSLGVSSRFAKNAGRSPRLRLLPGTSTVMSIVLASRPLASQSLASCASCSFICAGLRNTGSHPSPMSATRW